MIRIAFLLSVCLLTAVGSASGQTAPRSAEDERAHKAEADLWLDTVFGHCLALITGTPWSDFPAELRGKWDDLRPDYSSTLVQALYDPQVSTLRGSIILDVNEEGTSCWTQYSSLVPDYASAGLNAVIDTLAAEDRLKSAMVDQGYGPQQVGVILAGDERVPVIIYQSQSQDQQLPTIVTILQKTIPGFVYND